MRKVLISLGIAVFILAGAGWFMARFFTNGGRHAGSYTRGESRTAAAPAARDALTAAGPAASAPAKAAGEEAGAAAAAGAMLHGRVTDESDRGLEGAMVYVQRADDFRRGGDPARLFRDRFLGKDVGPRQGVAASQRTAADGSYSIPLSVLGPGSYEVVARHREFAARAEEWTWTPETSELNFQLPLGDAITGIVLDVEGHPVAGAAVEAYPEDEGFRGGGGFGRAFTDRDETEADGKFHLGVPSGTFRLAGKAKTFAGAEVRSVASGTQDIEMVLAPAPGLSGRVVDEEEKPVAAAIVQLVPRQDWGGRGGGRGGREGRGEDGRGGEGRGGEGPPARILRVFRGSDAKVETDADGRFRATDLSLGTYYVFAEKAGFVPSQSEVELSPEEKEASTSLTLHPGKVISGTVKDAEGNAVPGAFVVVGEDRSRDDGDEDRRERGRRGGRGGRDGERGEGEAAPEAPEEPEEPRPPEPLSPFRAVTATESDGGGKFLFDTLPSGRYSLSVQAEDFVAWRQDGIELDPPVKLDVVLDPGIALEGKVVSSAGGEAVAGARIVLRRDNDERREVKTDEEGRYRLHGLFPGRSLRVDLSAKGFSASTLEDFEIAASPATQTHDFKLDAAATLSGHITSTKGDPVFNARVSVVPVIEDESDGQNGFRGRRRQWTRPASTRTNPEGKFSLADVNAGPAFRVEVQHPDYKSFRSETFAIQPGAQLDGLAYALQAGGRLEVLVRDPGGAANPGARVRIALQETEEEVAAASESAGSAGGGAAEGRRGGGFGGRGGFDPRRFDPSRNMSRTSGPDGRAVFSGIKGGTYTVAASVPGFQPFSSQVAVVEDQLTPFTIDLLPENVITGTVTDGAGEPVAGARLEAMRELEDGRREGSEARADDKGAFRIGSLGAGPYRVRARQRGYSEAELRDVEVNREVAVVLQRLGGISGWVVAAETGSPVQEFAVRLRPERGSRQEGGEGGDLSSAFGGQGGGGFRGGPGGGDGAGGGAGGPGGRGGGFGRFDEGGFGGGRFGGGPGGGFGGFGGGPGGRRGREGRTFNDPAGLFALEEVRPGAYLLQVTADGYTGVELRVKVEEGKVTEGVEARLLAGIAAVGVVQAKGDMTPVAGAEVYLLPLQPREEEAETQDSEARREERRDERERRREARRNGERPADPQAALARLASGALQSAMLRGDAANRTDEGGAFQIKDITAGEYLLVVNHPDFVPALLETDFGLDGGARALRVILDGGEELTGALELPQGNAAAGVTVTLRDANGVTKRTTADGAGRYRFAGLVPGSYTLSVRAPEFGRTAPVTVEIRAGTNRLDHRLQAAGTAAVGSR